MKSIISPNESLGLAGAALDGRIKRASGHVSDLTFARIAQRMRQDAIDNELTYERDGKFEPIPVMLRPLLAMNEQMTFVHHVCQRLTDALKRLPTLYLNDEKVRRVIAITPAEEGWLRDTWTPAHDRNNTVYGRLDAVCDFTASAWQDTLHFMEANLSGVGGISYSPLCEQLVMRDIVPTLLDHDPALRIELPRDQRDLFIQVLIDHARSIGRDNCRLCFIEPKYAEDGINEQAVLCTTLGKRHNLTISHADPIELRIKDGEVYYGDNCIDVAYRDYETRDLIELEAEQGKPLDAMRLLFKQNRIVSSLVGDFDHKSCWEILTDPTLAEKYFNAEECRLFRRHVLWTRVIAERKTTLPHNVEGDLLEYVRTHREQLVLKPNRACGGEGVTIGAATSPAEWDRIINEGVANATDGELSWVVQKATRLPVSEFPIVGKDGRVFNEPFYTVMGFAPTENGLGTMCRVSQKQVVNVAQHGGMAAVLLAHAPDELRMPKRSMGRTDGPEQALRARIAELLHLDNAIAVLEWDEETKLPPGGREERGEQLAALETFRHTMLTSDHLGDLIEEVSVTRENDTRWRREIELLRDLRKSEIAMPEDLVRACANARSASAGAWEDARDQNNFALLAPALAETIKLTRETANACDGNADPYDVLLDEYEPGMTRARLEPVLNDLRARLAPLVQAATAKTASWPDKLMRTRKFPETKQWELVRSLLVAIGFDFSRGHLDRATHPGTTALSFDDIRIALRTVDDDLAEAILTALHEGGHGLYDQGLADEDRNTLLAQAPSMAMHEAQARLWENHVGRSATFWNYFFPHMRKGLGDAVMGLDGEKFFQTANKVSPTLIRATADELSYHLHILLRYELEVALISGNLAVKDLPGAWNDRSRTLIGAVPSTDREGVLQDGHWSAGMFGYFPTYTLGSLYAAQLSETYAADGKLDDEIARGDFVPLRTWLKHNIYDSGDRLPAEDLIAKVTGKGLDSAAYFRHIAKKFG
ncbi:MAG: carboxypeptidase M32 [Alphaproteobacteria bacterium]|nr:carboxypeptidase M32 [Alphaproteobacteria bacterium]